MRIGESFATHSEAGGDRSGVREVCNLDIETGSCKRAGVLRVERHPERIAERRSDSHLGRLSTGDTRCRKRGAAGTKDRDERSAFHIFAMIAFASIGRSKILFWVAMFRTGWTIAGVKAVANETRLMPRSLSAS